MHLQLFPTNVGVYEVEDYENINREILAIEGLRNNRFYFRNHIDLWQHRSQVPGLQKLYNALLQNAVAYASECYGSEYKPEYFTVLEGWANATKGRSANQDRLHNHRLTDLAAVYYASVTDDTGDIEFYDPRGGLGFVSLNSSKSYNVYAHKPKVGQMILFPGWLLHQVMPNKTDEDRISIASNIKLNEDVRYKG